MSFVLILVMGYVGVIALGVLVLFYGKQEGNSMWDRLYRFFGKLEGNSMWTVGISSGGCPESYPEYFVPSGTHIPNGIKGCARMVCGEKGPEYVQRSWNYIVWSNNPIVQIFYLLIVVSGYVIFAVQGYPHIPNA